MVMMISLVWDNQKQINMVPGIWEYVAAVLAHPFFPFNVNKDNLNQFAYTGKADPCPALGLCHGSRFSPKYSPEGT